MPCLCQVPLMVMGCDTASAVNLPILMFLTGQQFHSSCSHIVVSLSDSLLVTM